MCTPIFPLAPFFSSSLSEEAKNKFSGSKNYIFLGGCLGWGRGGEGGGEWGGLTNEGPGNCSCDLRTNQRP